MKKLLSLALLVSSTFLFSMEIEKESEEERHTSSYGELICSVSHDEVWTNHHQPEELDPTLKQSQFSLYKHPKENNVRRIKIENWAKEEEAFEMQHYTNFRDKVIATLLERLLYPIKAPSNAKAAQKERDELESFYRKIKDYQIDTGDLHWEDKHLILTYFHEWNITSKPFICVRLDGQDL